LISSLALAYPTLAAGRLATHLPLSLHQAIYGEKDHIYNFTGNPVLKEQADGLVAMGSNHMKLALSPSSCAGYRVAACSPTAVYSLKTLSEAPDYATVFAHKGIVWYHLWLYSFATAKPMAKQTNMSNPATANAEYVSLLCELPRLFVLVLV
jgi:hypothetical protein